MKSRRSAGDVCHYSIPTPFLCVFECTHPEAILPLTRPFVQPLQQWACGARTHLQKLVDCVLRVAKRGGLLVCTSPFVASTALPRV